MRFLGIVPVLLCIASLVLAFLCLFAGDHPGFMEDYALITLNASRFGENFIQDISTAGQGDPNNPFQQLWNNITDTIQNGINGAINDVARDLGLRDFYSLHVLTYCEGNYEPGALPNATLSRSQIWSNVTQCSNRTALFQWDPRTEIQKQLNQSGVGFIDITKLKWPDQIDDSIKDIQSLFKASFVLYCVAIALIFIALVGAILSIFLLGSATLISNVIIDVLAFLAVGIASALITAVMQQGTKNISGYGKNVGIDSYYSTKFLAITWVATALMFVASLVWCFDCVVARRRGRGRTVRSEKAQMSSLKSHH